MRRGLQRGRFFESVWPDVKRAFACLETLDTDGDHLLDADQAHALDAAWSGRIAWISSSPADGVDDHEVTHQQSGSRVTLDLPREIETRAGPTASIVLQA